MCALIHGCFEKCNPLKSHQMQLHPRNFRPKLLLCSTFHLNCMFPEQPIPVVPLTMLSSVRCLTGLVDWTSAIISKKYPLCCRLFACSYIAKNYIKNVYNYITSFRCPCSKPWDVWTSSIPFFIYLTKSKDTAENMRRIRGDIMVMIKTYRMSLNNIFFTLLLAILFVHKQFLTIKMYSFAGFLVTP